MFFSDKKNHPRLALYSLLCAFLFTLTLIAREEATFEPPPAKLEEILLFILNQERINHQLPPLSAHPSLKYAARRHSSKMAMEKTLNHDFPAYDSPQKRLASAGLTFFSSGENVARGTNITMRLIHDALMKSPPHRDNILNPEFKSIGIGIVLVGQEIYITQEFATLFSPSAISAIEENLRWQLQTKLPLKKNLSSTKQQELQSICRNLADHVLKGDDFSLLTQNHPNDLITIIHFQMIDDDVIELLFSAICLAKTHYWELGISFRRTDVNPGGIYVIVLYCVVSLSQ